MFDKAPSADDYLLIDRLREDAAAGRMDLSSILSEVTHAARYFTDATGAALALWSQGVVICRARSGETAPPLGTKLEVDSGISGECLRTGYSQRCQDADTDPRVDPETCREMGIRSIAAVPLPGAQGVIGILEVFSDQANAFSDAHITLLKKLAQIAVTSRARSVKAIPVSSVPLDTAPLSHSSPSEENLIVLPPRPEPETFAFLPARMRGEEGQPLRLAAAALLLLILGIAGWIVRSHLGTSRGAQPVRAASQAVPDLVAAGDAATAVNSPTNSGPQAVSTITLSRGSKPRPDLMAGEVVHKAASSVVVERTPPNSTAVLGEAKPASSSPSPSPPEPDMPAPDAGQALSGLSQTVPQSVANPQPVFPFVAVPVSQGVTGGRLIHRVDPLYPAEIRLQRIEGAVLLDALVGEDGRVKQVQVNSGPAVLARAAADAVKQWRYEPYLLNGKPVAIHNQITIQFKLP